MWNPSFLTRILSFDFPTFIYKYFDILKKGNSLYEKVNQDIKIFGFSSVSRILASKSLTISDVPEAKRKISGSPSFPGSVATLFYLILWMLPKREKTLAFYNV